MQKNHKAASPEDDETLVADLSVIGCESEDIQNNLEQCARDCIGWIENSLIRQYKDKTGLAVLPSKALERLKARAVEIFRTQHTDELSSKLGRGEEYPGYF